MNVRRYCDDTKTRYLQQSVLPESDWPPSLAGQYIKLALIRQDRSLFYEEVIERQKDYTRGDYDKILADKTEIELKVAFSEDRGSGKKLPLKMLIDGAPGVGKTTLSRKISRMWAKGILFEKYWLVLLLHLRERTISNAETIDDFFRHEDSDLQHDVVKYVKERSGDGVLMIFDGFDELSLYKRSEESLFLHICKRRILPRCAVIITSRPYASRSLQVLSSINRHIEILGFTDEHVKTCIRQKLKDKIKAQKLCAELKDRLDIASICQIPLNCSIVLYVYKYEKYSLPRTLTELYGFFILHSLKRFIKRTQNSRAADRLSSIDRLPNPSKMHLKSLCQLAFKGLEEDQLVFTREDLESLFPEEYQDLESDKDLPVMDLMTSAKSYSSRGAHDTYSFLHLTIQEYLAAYWASHYLTDAEKLQFLKKYLMNDRFRMVLLFFSGLTKLNFPGLYTVFSKESWNQDNVHICHLLYECGSQSICKYFSENYVSKSIKLCGSSFDVLVVSHFIACSGYQLDELELRPEDVKIVHKMFSIYAQENTGTSIKKTSILFCTGHSSPIYYERLLHSTDTHFSDVFVPGPKSFESYNRLSIPAYNTPITKVHINLALLKLLDDLSQITSIFVGIRIGRVYPESCQRLFVESLGAVLVGSHAICRKHYTVILNYVSLSDIGIDYHSAVNSYMTKLFQILAQCLAQNQFVGIILEFKLLNNTASIFARLTKDISISALTHFCCTLEDKAQNLFLKVLSADVVDFLISTQKSLQYLEFGLNDHICTHFWVIKSALIKNTTLQKLKICNGLFEFNRNHRTNEMELTRSTTANIPLKFITSISIVPVQSEAIVVIKTHKGMSKVLPFKMML